MWRQSASKLPAPPATPGISEPPGPANLSSGFKSSGQATVWGSNTVCGLDRGGSPLGGRPPSAEGLDRVELRSPGGGFWRPAVPLHGNIMSFVSSPPSFLSGSRTEGELPPFLLHFPRAPLSNNSGTSPKQPITPCQCLPPAVPQATFLRHWDRPGPLCGQLESLLHLSLLMVCVAFFLSASVSAHASLFPPPTPPCCCRPACFHLPHHALLAAGRAPGQRSPVQLPSAMSMFTLHSPVW